MVNPTAMFQMMNLWNRFKNNHPKFPQFMTAVMQNGVTEGTVFEINVTTADGRTISTNMKITADDMQIFNELKSTMPGNE